MFWQRLLSAIIGVPVLITAVWYGGAALLTVTVALMLLGVREISVIFAKLDLKVPLFMVMPGCLILAAAAYKYKEGYPDDISIIILIFYLVVMISFYPRFTPLDVAASFFCTIYVGLLIFLFLLSTLPNGWIWLILMLVCTWSSDTLAYLAGRRWGRRRMAPELSPGKTVEGALGGVLGSIIAAWVVVLLYIQLPLWPVLLLGLIIGLAAQAGDLVESAIKRLAGIKDAGKLIPGHGGVLDRFDSMLFTAPLVYYYVGLILN
ncbi:phosphatidate cytidylyltransferase [Desulfoscipio sp. XC116]|uniref:phosphatidate cytidylyltransferase n=1 Tax=Desulfoscipio sp. XC116 TaxID=3144975 RepID=UPI00325B9F8C